MIEFLSPHGLFIVAASCSLALMIAALVSIWLFRQAMEIAPMIKERKQLEERKQELEKEIADLKDQKIRSEKIIEDSQNAEKNLEELAQKIDDGNHQKEELNRELEELKISKTGLDNAHNEKQQQLAELNVKLEESNQRYKSQEEEHLARLEQLETKCTGLESDIYGLTSRQNLLQAQNQELEEECSLLRARHDRLQKALDDLERDIKRKKDELEGLSRFKAEGEVECCHLRKETQLMKEQLAKLEEQQGKLRQGNAEAENRIARANVLAKNEANMWTDLERDVATITEKPEGTIAVDDEVKALDDFQKMLGKCGYKFHPRTIRAFHTGLLCGDVSPLVILSGVSGTGKSLLPKLYAKYFNMNFLPVAVQPRWDGPQDVFGFYNHMEERYKATELSRLLWQFDRFNNKSAEQRYPKNRWAQFPMSLVLLDEMNLARVEYYFSELLSKLEFRNDIDTPDVVQNRRAAEVELEYGSSSISDTKDIASLGRRLFIDYNILLAGTMNEDESTQSLSSKVIDRANILRFGSISNDNREATPTARDTFETYCRSFVSYGQWNAWRCPKGEEIKDIGNVINELNQQLTRVNRGFGYRTEKAIRRYVELYPGNKNEALIDQIEMKILPKLNGVPVDSIKGEIQTKIVDILAGKDGRDVGNAFEDTLRREESFFAWQGVRR